MKLELRNVTKRFGAVLANDHLNITIDSGTIHAIVGENGAGKSTAMRIAYGFYTADSGEILLNDEVRDIRAPRDAIALGIGMVHQHFMLVRPMTVTENIVLGAEPGSAVALDLRKRPPPFAACLKNSGSRWIPTRPSKPCPSASNSVSSS
jgi:simple sugar transport system ATP-binding protein